MVNVDFVSRRVWRALFIAAGLAVSAGAMLVYGTAPDSSSIATD